jgi:hypothetical protein
MVVKVKFEKGAVGVKKKRATKSVLKKQTKTLKKRL